MSGIFKRKKRSRFGEIAVKKGLVSEKELTDALNLQKEYAEKHEMHREIGTILAQKGVLSPEDVKIILEEQKGHNNIMAWFHALFGLSR